jgi:outer membrane lipoprotein-sorting protein
MLTLSRRNEYLGPVFAKSFIALFFSMATTIVMDQALAQKKPSSEEDAETKLVLKAISQKYNSLGSWQGRITEERVSAGLGGLSKFYEGKIYFARPDRFRYEISTKPSTLAVSNGLEFWFGKFPEGISKKGQVKHFKNLSGVELDKYLAFLRGIDVQNPDAEKKLFADFHVVAKYEKTHLVLNLKPKTSNEIQSIEMHYMQTENHPNRIIIEDVIGTTTTIRVLESSPLGKINPKLFAPSFAKGSEVEDL